MPSIGWLPWLILRRVPIAAAHDTASFDIFLIGKVAEPCERVTVRRHVVAHEALDQDVELGLTLIAFAWRAHATAPQAKNPADKESKLQVRGALIAIKIPSRECCFFGEAAG